MKHCWAALSITYLVSGCATTGTASTAEPTTDVPTTIRAQNDASPKQRERTLSDELTTMKKRYAELESKFATAQATLDRAVAAKTELQEQADANAELTDTMKQQIAELTEARDKLMKQLAETATGLDELRKQKAATEATYREVVDKLRAMSEAGQLKIATRDGRMFLALSNDILFDSGRTDIKPRGKAALAKIAQVLTSVAERKFLVAGHTDNVPIRSGKFSSNWELSTRRAVEVVHYLVSQHMSPDELAAAGYGEFNPVVPNDTADHRAQNRRIEIVLLPSVLELPMLDNATSPPAKP